MSLVGCLQDDKSDLAFAYDQQQICRAHDVRRTAQHAEDPFRCVALPSPSSIPFSAIATAAACNCLGVQNFWGEKMLHVDTFARAACPSGADGSSDS